MKRVVKEHFTQEQYDALLKQIEDEKESSNTLLSFFQSQRSPSSESIETNVLEASTLPSTVLLDEQVILDDRILNELKDAYLGVDDVRFPLRDQDKAKIDNVHRQYFGAHLKEKSLQNILINMDPFTQAYTDLYKDLLFEPEKKTGLGSIFSKLKGFKLPENDAIFFNNLNNIKSYIQGDVVQNIAEKLDYVLNQRAAFLKILPEEERKGKSSQELKWFISNQRYNHIFKAFKEFTQEYSGTAYMRPAMDSFIDDFKDSFKDLKVDIPFVYTYAVASFLKNEYNAIIRNRNIEEPEREKVKEDLSNLDKRLYEKETSGYTNASFT